MLKKILTIAVTLLILISVSFGFSLYFHSEFLDFSFIVGLIATIITWFFVSTDGAASRPPDHTIRVSTGLRNAYQKSHFTPNLPFVTSLIYTLLSIVVMH
ncbi:hypothetical protein [Neobacillus muris]|uniref:hypothetical protein n=1 Tax=Neobacillus muris TaxID=2941334 RepID=UPI0020402F19|nr:hypothetical protein [Neobacillus muris]